MKTATHLTSKGQVVIPKPIRERLRWRAGTRLAVETAGEGAIVLRAETAALDSLLGELAGCLDEGDALAAHEAEHRYEVESEKIVDERRRRSGR